MSASGSLVGWVAVMGCLVVACGSEGGSSNGGTAGTSGAGAPSAGSPGSAGSWSTAGMGNGTSGSSNGVAGSDASGGTSGGSTGEAGAAGSSPDPNTPSELGVNDVTYVWPLPDEGQESALLGLSESGAKGALLSKELSDEIVQPAFPRSQGVYDLIRVVALRLDPCAGQTEVKDKSSCQSEIRLVTQPIESGSAFDAGVHLTYRVSRAELDAALAELRALKSSTDIDVRSAPLGRHPIMLEQGLDGAFAKGVKAVVLKYVGMSNLGLLTEFSLGPEGGDWFFDKFEKNAQGKFVHASIPLSLNENKDTIGTQFIVEEGSGEASRSTAIGDIDFSVGFPEALLKSSNVPNMAPQALADALNRLAAIENPNRHSASTVDCGSCHEAGNARGFYEKMTGSKATETFSAPAGQNITRKDEAGLDASALHALSYLGKSLQVSPRVINESARVADWLGSGF